jgi:glycosyltransferase involved in cell wall biosynthesis
MKVFYDHQIFEHQQYGGISRYYSRLISHTKDRSDVNYILSLINSSNQYLKEIPEVAATLSGDSDYYHKFLGGLEFPGKWKLYQQRNKWLPGRIRKNLNYSEKMLREASFDLFHPTDFDNYFLKYIGNRPFVVTVHDMIDEYFPEYSFHVHSNYKTSIKEQLIKKAAGVIAVSHSTKHDLLERFSVDEKKIRVIHHAADEMPIYSYEPIMSGCYFLFVGKRSHYKNFYFFLQAIQPFLLNDREIKIVCVGAPFNGKEYAFFRDLQIEASVINMSADDSTLGNLYKYARAFVYPSLYEGFGLPILEAFQCECPVMVSNTSSLPEIAGDAALFFSPKDIHSVRSAFKRMLTDDFMRKDLIEKGRQQLQKFSWRATSEQTFDFYKSIV